VLVVVFCVRFEVDFTHVIIRVGIRTGDVMSSSRHNWNLCKTVREIKKERKNMFAQLMNLDISIPLMLQNQQQRSSER